MSNFQLIKNSVRSAASPATGGTQSNELQAAIKSITSSTTVGAVFLYDTSQDSDGGKWRKKCKGLSWFDEASSATRSARSEFPAMALIVADTAVGVTIYDLDDPAMPMWMVIPINGILDWATGVATSYCLDALNGRIYIGINDGAAGFNLVKDYVEIYYSGAYTVTSGRRISDRGDTSTFISDGVGPDATIVNSTINDIAATVLEGAEIGALGLPIPTVCCGTNGGVSVITPSGSVYNITNAYDSSYSVSAQLSLVDNNTLACTLDTSGSSRDGWWLDLRTLYANATVHATTNAGGLGSFSKTGEAGDIIFIGNNVSALAKDAIGTEGGLSVYKLNEGNPAESMVSHHTATYATGYMVGDIRGAWLAGSRTSDRSVKANTLAGSVTAGVVATDAELGAYSGFSASNYLSKPFALGSELVTNGTFTSNITGWTDASTGSGSIAHATNLMNVVGAGLSNRGKARQTVTGLTVGAHYRFQFTLAGVNNEAVRLDDSQYGGTDYTPTAWSSNQPGNGTHEFIFKAVTTSFFIEFEIAGTGTMTVDNVSLKLASDVDFSTPATGRNGNSTGDFSIMFWCKSAATGGNEDYASRSDATPEAGDWALRKQTTEKFTWYGHGASGWGDFQLASSVIVGTTWTQVAVVRRNGVLNFYFNGQFDVSATDTNSYTPSGGSALTIGRRLDTSAAATNASMSLFRISATAPSPQQIKEIYEAEKPLFQANAKCLLQYSGYNNILGLSYDKSTGLLTAAGKNESSGAGATIFRGLEAVDTFSGKDHSDWATGGDGFSTISKVSSAGGVSVYSKTTATGGTILDLPALDVRAELNEGEDKLPDDGKLHFEGVTTDATPTVIAYLPLEKYSTADLVIKATMQHYQTADSGHWGNYQIRQRFYRQTSGAIARTAASKLVYEGTSTLDVTTSTATDYITVSVTGAAGARLVWTASVEVQRISDKLYER